MYCIHNNNNEKICKKLPLEWVYQLVLMLTVNSFKLRFDQKSIQNTFWQKYRAVENREPISHAGILPDVTSCELHYNFLSWTDLMLIESLSESSSKTTIKRERTCRDLPSPHSDYQVFLDSAYCTIWSKTNFRRVLNICWKCVLLLDS